MSISRWLDDFWQDLRQAGRMLSRSPGFTVAAVLSLGLGIGANAAIFGVIDALMLRTLPVAHPEQLVRFVYPGEDYGFSYPAFETFRDQTRAFSDIAAICVLDRVRADTAGGNGLDDEQIPQIHVGLVSGSYFSTLGMSAAIGRPLTTDDDRIPGGHPVTVVSDSYWTRRYARAPDIAGRVLTLNGTAYTIVGVTPHGFSGDWIGRSTDVWIPMAMQAQVMPERPLLANPGPPWLRIVARLKPGVTLAQAQTAVQAVYPLTIAAQSLSLRQREAAVRTYPTVESGARGFSPQRVSFAQPLAILMSVVGLVLLIACANVANLTLARSASRAREFGVRLALGATRSRVVRQLLTESGLVATLGGALGLLVAAWGSDAFATFARSSLATDLDVRIGGRVLAFTAASSLMTGMIFGLAPAFRASQPSAGVGLTERGIGHVGRFRIGKALVILQIAASFVLLVGAGLLVRSLWNLQSQDLGFDRQRVLLIWTAPDQAGRRGADLAAVFQLVQDRVSSLPGVLSASPSTHGILSGFFGNGPVLRVQGLQPRPGAEPTAPWNVVAPRFFETTGMRLLIGRDFTARDTEAAPHVAIVNQTLARDFFGDDNPIGRRFGKGGEDGYPWEIVGVVADAKDNAPRDAGRRMFYVPYRQDVAHLDAMCLAVRTAADPTSLISPIRRTLRDLDPRMPVLRVETVDEQLDGSLGQERLMASLSGAFGVVATVLCCIGLYGVMAYVTARRTSEIGIRIALGATYTAVLRMILSESLVVGLVGTAMGAPIAVVAGRLIASRLFGISPNDAATMVGAAALMIIVAALAGWVPASRAARVDPMIALRCE